MTDTDTDLTLFRNWRLGPARGVLRRATGYDVADAISWDNYRQTFTAHMNVADADTILARIEDKHGVMSSGEQVLLEACLMAADYSRLADKLAGVPGIYSRLWYNVSGDFRISVAAAFLRREG